jgi:hypothetical protein
MTSERSEAAASDVRDGLTVVSADGIVVGTVAGQTGSHIHVRAEASDSPTGEMFLPRGLIDSVAGDLLRLNIERADIHEAVYCLPPGQQREFETLIPRVRLGRARGL